jgi:predicted dehydrogenase
LVGRACLHPLASGRCNGRSGRRQPPRPSALKEITERFGIAKGYTDYRELLAEEKPDGVVIVSPHTVHHEQAMAALTPALMC